MRCIVRSHERHKMKRLFEIVPNISEGKDAGVVDSAVAAIERCGAVVLDRTSDPVHHRSVITAAGDARSVLDAGVAVAGVALRRIDIRAHSGEHPRMGALDVLPFVPLGEATMEEAIALAHEAGEQIWQLHHIPSFYYEQAAMLPERRLLANVRPHPTGAPDSGELPFHPTAGAIAIGARTILIAFNIELATSDLSVAQSIAAAIRERDGGLRTLRARAFRRSGGVVQVSLNVTNERATPLYRIVRVVSALAADRGVEILRSELVGCIPRNAVVSAALYALGVEDTTL